MSDDEGLGDKHQPPILTRALDAMWALLHEDWDEEVMESPHAVQRMLKKRLDEILTGVYVMQEMTDIDYDIQGEYMKVVQPAIAWRGQFVPDVPDGASTPEDMALLRAVDVYLEWQKDDDDE